MRAHRLVDERLIRHRVLAIITLAYYRPARLTQETERLEYIKVWRTEAKEPDFKLFPEKNQRTRPHVNATILWLAIGGFLDLSPNDRYALLCPTSAILLLSNPFLSLDNFAEALLFIASKLPEKHSLEAILEQSVDELLGIHTSVRSAASEAAEAETIPQGMQIIELSKRYTWVLARISAKVNAGTVRYIVDEPEFLEPYTENPIEIGVRKAMAEQSLNHPEWLDMTPKKGECGGSLCLRD